MAEKDGLPKKANKKALDAFIEAIEETMPKESIVLVGFGTFSAKTRAARRGRNPITGAIINIPEKKVPHVKFGRTIKAMIK